MASSSRSQVQTRTASAAVRLAWDRPSVGVRWRPPLAVVIVTHLVTRPLASRCSERLFRRSSRASLRPVTLQLSDQHASPWMTALLLPRPGRFGGDAPYFHPHTDCRKRHSTLRQTAGKQSFTRHCPARLDISPRSARVYHLMRTSKYAAPDPGSAGITALARS
jgi:hypothetical protein